MANIGIPKYYSPLFNVPQDVKFSPAEKAQFLNEKIARLNPKKELLVLISSIALAALGALAVVISMTASGAPYYLKILSAGVAAVVIAFPGFESYRIFAINCMEIAKKSASLPRPQFIYLDRFHIDGKDLIPDSKWARIANYFPYKSLGAPRGFQLPIRREQVFHLSGGEVNLWSATPIEVRVESVKDNRDGIFKKYLPWVHLMDVIGHARLIEESEKTKMCKEMSLMINGDVLDILRFKYSIQGGEVGIKLVNDQRFEYRQEGKERKIIGRHNGEEFVCHTADEFANFLNIAYGLNIRKTPAGEYQIL